MKIEFIVPPSKNIPERTFGCSYSIYPQPEMAILYAAASLESAGFEVSIKDFTLEGNNSEAFLNHILKDGTDIYIFHTVLLSQKVDLQAAASIHEHHPDTPIIFFGPHPTYDPGAFLKDENMFVIRGEVEETLPEFVGALKEGDISTVKGISYISDGKLHETGTAGIIQDLDAIPYPSRHMVERLKERYYNPKLKRTPSTSMLTSRGCVHHCYYCVPNSISWARELEYRRFNNNRKPPVKIRSAGDVLEELESIADAGYKSVSIIDDMFLWGGKERIKEICTGIKALDIEFGILARCDYLSEDIVKILAKAGCRYVDMGIESFDPQVLEYIHKDLKPESIRRSIDLLNREGIEPKINIMLGTCPLEDKKCLEKTIQDVSGMPVGYAMFSIATPFPGTEFEKVAREEGWILEERYRDIVENLDPSSKSLINYPNLSAQELETLIRKANRRFYLKPRRILKQLLKVRSQANLKSLIAGGLRLVK